MAVAVAEVTEAVRAGRKGLSACRLSRDQRLLVNDALVVYDQTRPSNDTAHAVRLAEAIRCAMLSSCFDEAVEQEIKTRCFTVLVKNKEAEANKH